MNARLLARSVVAAALAACAVGASATTNVGVSVGIYQPGVYGRIDIGNFPAPAVVNPQPVIIQPAPVVVGVPVQPVYLYVPPGHQKNWSKHCGRYNACGRPVYFVQESWIEQNAGRGPGSGGHPGKGHGKGKGKHD